VNALLALIHASEAVDPLLMSDVALSASMFTDMRNLAAFEALAKTATVVQAMEIADPGAAELLLQLSVAELDGEPEDAVGRLVSQTARRLIATTKQTTPEVHQALLEVDEPLTRRAAIEQLLTWLSSRSEEVGG
jgi:hypothetical protein